MKTFYKVIMVAMLAMICNISITMAVSAPTFTSTPASGSKMNVGDTVEVVVKTANNRTALNECEYSLNGSVYRSIFDLKGISSKPGEIWKLTFRPEKFSEAGTYVLKMKAVDEYDNVSTATFRYIVEDTSAFIFTANPESGSKLYVGDKVKISVETANNSTALSKCEYSLNGSKYQSIYDFNDNSFNQCEIYRFIFYPQRFNEVGEYELKVRATDEYDNVEEMTFNYIVEDVTAPVISMNKESGSVLEPGEALTIVVEDLESKITSLTYKWNSQERVNFVPEYKDPANKFTIKNLKIGTLPGTYTINITAENEEGKKSEATYRYIVEDEEEIDDVAPTISVRPESGEIEQLSTVLLVLEDDKELKSLKYYWDNDSAIQNKISGTVKMFEIDVPTKSGKHKLYVEVKDAAANQTNEVFTYNVVENDEEVPTVSANPESGTIEPGSIITLTLKDNEALKLLQYYWDNDSSIKKTLSGTNCKVKVRAPSTDGKHELYVRLSDETDNRMSAVFVYNVIEIDEQAPTISTNIASQSTIVPSTAITLTLKDNEALKSMTYRWDSNSNIVKTVSGTSISVRVTAPATVGTHRLYVTLNDAAGNKSSKTLTYIVKKADKTAPTISASVASQSTIVPSTAITLTLKDNEALKSMTYRWDSNSNIVKTVSGTSTSVRVTAPATVGTHRLYVTLNDAAGNKASKTLTYIVKKADKTAPTVSANPVSSKKVSPSATITLTVKDNEALKSITYSWDNGGTVTKSLSGKSTTVKVTAPRTIGTHKLSVTILDSSNNQIKNTFTYTVKL